MSSLTNRILVYCYYQSLSIRINGGNMLRAFLGLPPPTLPKSSEEKQQVYDQTKRKRKLVPSWNEEFREWLITDPNGEGKLFCRICRSVYGPLSSRTVNDKYRKYANGNFVHGSCNLRHDSLVTHEHSEGHNYAVQYQKEKQKFQNAQSSADQVIKSLKLKGLDLNKLSILFRNAHALAKHCKPISDFNWINDLQEKNNVNLGQSYRNSMSCKEFLIAIAAKERANFEDLLMRSKFITIMSDGSTDVSVVENEIVYVHFSIDGQIHTLFAGLIECSVPNAEGIYEAILQALAFNNLTLDELKSKIIGFAADGASVNTGKLNGVIMLFRRRINPATVMIQCMSHRLELAFKDAMKKSAMYGKVYSTLDELFKFYKSAKQTAGLKHTFQELGLAQCMPTRIGGTRWVGHFLTALKSLFKGYRAFVKHLEQVSTVNSGSSGTQSKAKYLLKMLKTREVISFAHFVKDVVCILSKLSMFMQTKSTSVYQVHRELESAVSSLEKLETRPGPDIRLFQQQRQFQGQELSGNENECSKHMKIVIQAIIASMSSRFTDISGAVLQATRLADLGSWPSSLADAPDFGDEGVANLVDHFRGSLENQGVDPSLVEIEWASLKSSIYNDLKHVEESKVSQILKDMEWPTIHQKYKDNCHNILCVMDLIMSLPAGSSECERGFSQMSLTKTKYRNKLRSSTMTLLMTIQMHSADIAGFDPIPAIEVWSKSNNRRPAFLKCRKSNVGVMDQMEQMYAEAGEGAAVVEASASQSPAEDQDSGL